MLDVTVGGRNGRMAQLALNDVQRRPFTGKLEGVGVSQPVRMAALVDPRLARQPGKQRADVRRLDRLPLNVQNTGDGR